ncbi:hypothetical protein [Bradyrhizobium sp. dw_78]|uniref:hypothetical protein n=1 Tax=Bradyrhizobium sp. dw_78 TaxID=2719793 RepID=UPI001BD2A0FC|nr:hypothetical protein [Bradyrhizobium sp. dw_78]
MEFLLLLIILLMLGIITAQPTVNGMTIKGAAVQKRKGIARRSEPELTLAPEGGSAPDPRLVEFVRLLARHAARQWYDQAEKEQGSKRS